jgi:hypothetical protein
VTIVFKPKPWIPPEPIVSGSEEERLDLEELNRMRRWASFKVWHWHQMEARDDAIRAERRKRRASTR